MTGEKLTATPDGIPLTVNETGALKPAVSLRVKPKLVLEPGRTVADVGLSLSAKLGGTVTASVTVTLLVTPPPAAVMVIEWLPVDVVEVASKVRTLEPDPGAAKDDGEKPAVTPLGRPLTLNATAASKPLIPLTVKVSGVVPPWTRLIEPALAASVKLGGGATVTDNGSVPVNPPPVAVIRTLYVPGAVCVVALTVSVPVPEPGAAKLAGDKLTVMPLGWPEAESVILELKPPPTLRLNVVLALAPCVTVIELEVLESVKLGCAVTVRLNGSVSVTPAPVAETCRG